MPRPDQRAAGNKPPKDGVGLTRKLDETNEKTRQSDGVRQTEPRKTQGAGPALAKHTNLDRD